MSVATLERTAAEVRLMPTSKLKVDHTYQRQLVPKRAEALALGWDERLAGVLIVSVRDNGESVVLDGQHRLAAMRELGIQAATCLLLFGLTLETEAALFAATNTKRWGVHVIDRFRAMVVAKDKRAVQIQDAIVAAGLHVSFNTAPGSVAAIGALDHIFLWGSLPVTLRIIREAWPDDAISRGRTMLLGVAAFDRCHRGEKYDERRLISVLAPLSPRQILESAKARASYGASKSEWKAVGQILTENYNKGLRLRLSDFEAPELLHVGGTVNKPKVSPAHTRAGARD